MASTKNNPSDNKVRFIVESTPINKSIAPPNDFLIEGLEKLNLKLDATRRQKLLDYVDLMIKWNRAYNLTSVREPREIITRHIFDSLSIGPYLQGNNIIDVGSGAGLPGIPLAIAYPDKHFTLIDSNGKKARFLFHIQHSLKLNNVLVINERVEGYQKLNELKSGTKLRQFDTIVSRAFSSIRDMLYNTEHLCKADGLFLAMKGVYPLTELHEIPPEFHLQEVVKLEVPFLDSERHLVKIAFE